ncbi:hypothetical protein BB561_003377 [Smittium simulii]|uniref:Uncharacterized protein n=1 Tax=Smittium simulii TaxID=133385 RepID=A0A2T9YLL7_9FUNG|nr:hypothetical protein BB561_003377 [Smittium simulii]
MSNNNSSSEHQDHSFFSDNSETADFIPDLTANISFSNSLPEESGSPLNILNSMPNLSNSAILPIEKNNSILPFDSSKTFENSNDFEIQRTTSSPKEDKNNITQTTNDILNNNLPSALVTYCNTDSKNTLLPSPHNTTVEPLNLQDDFITSLKNNILPLSDDISILNNLPHTQTFKNSKKHTHESKNIFIHNKKNRLNDSDSENMINNQAKITKISLDSDNMINDNEKAKISLDAENMINNQAKISSDSDNMINDNEKAKISSDSDNMINDNEKAKISSDSDNMINDNEKAKISSDSDNMINDNEKAKISSDSDNMINDNEKAKISSDSDNMINDNEKAKISSDSDNMINDNEKAKISSDSDNMINDNEKAKISSDSDNMINDNEKAKISSDSDNMINDNEKAKISSDSDNMINDNEKAKISSDSDNMINNQAKISSDSENMMDIQSDSSSSDSGDKFAFKKTSSDEPVWHFEHTLSREETLRFDKRVTDTTMSITCEFDPSLLDYSNSQLESIDLSTTYKIFSLKKNTSMIQSFKLETIGVLSKACSSNFTDKKNINSNLCAVLSEKEINISIDNNMFIVSANSGKHLTTIKSENNSQAITFSNQSLFIAYGDQSGSLYILHSLSKTVIFKQNFASEILASTSQKNIKYSNHGKFISLRFVKCNDEIEELILVYSRDNFKVMVRYSNLNLFELNKAICESDFNLASNIKSQIYTEKIDLNQYHLNGVLDMEVVYNMGNWLIYLSGKGDASISVWKKDFNNNTICIDWSPFDKDEAAYKQIGFSSNKKILIALNFQGNIDLYEPNTLTLVKKLTNFGTSQVLFLSHESWVKLADSATVSSKNTDSVPVVLLSAENKQGKKRHRIISIATLLPTPKQYFSIQVSNKTTLPKDLRSSNECIDSVIFLEGVKNRYKSKVFIRSLSQAVPLERLCRLLRNKQFEASLQFASYHNLDLQNVYIDILSDFVEKSKNYPISNLPKDTELDPNLNIYGKDYKFFIKSFLELCTKTKASSTVVDLCLRLVTSTIESTKEILDFASSIADNEIDKQRCNAIIYKMDTFISLTGINVDTNTYDHFEIISMWVEFRELDLDQIVRDLVSGKNYYGTDSIGERLDASLIIWRRHMGHNKELQQDIINVIKLCPSDINIELFSTWIRQVFKFIESALELEKACDWLYGFGYDISLKEEGYYDTRLIINEIIHQYSLRINTLLIESLDYDSESLNQLDTLSQFPEIYSLNQPKKYLDFLVGKFAIKSDIKLQISINSNNRLNELQSHFDTDSDKQIYTNVNPRFAKTSDTPCDHTSNTKESSNNEFRIYG